MPNLSPSLQNVIAPIVEALGYEFWGGQYGGHGSGSLLRIYIDKENGVTVEDCQRVSRQLTAVLDVEAVIAPQYTLEVSSPGIDRPLFTLEQFKRFVGSPVRLKTHTPIDGQSRFVGEIFQIMDDQVIIKVDGQELALPFSQIEKANLTA